MCINCVTLEQDDETVIVMFVSSIDIHVLSINILISINLFNVFIN
jgi:hypothetical protein